MLENTGSNQNGCLRAVSMVHVTGMPVSVSFWYDYFLSI